MKKRSLKIMSVVLAGVMTTGMILGGCSAGGDKENGGNKEASKELNLWMHNGQAFVDETKKLAENYEKETGVKINIQTFPYDAMSQKMKAAFTAGNEPDIMQVFGAWIPTYMNQKLLAEVPEELSANFETDYLQGAVDGYAKDGTYYGVPIEMNVEYGLFYNREDAAAAGVPDGPKTFDDVMKIAKNSAKFNGDVQEYGGLEFYNGDNFAALFLSWIMQNGGDFWNEDQTKFVLTSPEAKEAWQKLVDLVTVEKVTDTKHITAKMPTEQYFFANKAAQLVKGSWASAVGDDLENENWKYVFMPPVKGDIPYFAVESGWGYVVSENSKNKDTAWDFVKYCMEPENAKEFNLGRSFFRGWMFLPAVVPIVAVCYVWLIMFDPANGVLNQALMALGMDHPINWLNDPRTALFSIVLVTLWCDLGYNLVILMSGLDNIPNMFLEAAEIDGANSIQKFFKITLPLMSRNMLFVVIMTCISYFQVFAQVQIMTQGGPENHTNVIGLNIYNYAFRYSQMGYASAMAVVLLGIILIVSLVQLKVGKQDWEY